MGWPLTLIAVAVTVWAVKAANKAEGRHEGKPEGTPQEDAGPAEQESMEARSEEVGTDGRR